jgi:hypothetical protein
MTITPRYAPATQAVGEDDFLLYVNKTGKAKESQSMVDNWSENWKNWKNDKLGSKIDDWIKSIESSYVAEQSANVIASEGEPDLLMNITVHIPMLPQDTLSGTSLISRARRNKN